MPKAKKIYVARAIRGEKSDLVEFFIPCVSLLVREHNHQIINPHVFENNPIEVLARTVFKKTAAELTAEEIQNFDIQRLNESEIVIAEFSGASTGVGREIEYARTKHSFGNPAANILCLHHKHYESSASPMIRGMSHRDYPNVFVHCYDKENLRKILIEFFARFI